MDEKFTEADLDNCWLHYKAYFIEVLNKEYGLDEAVEDLRSLVGSVYDSREGHNQGRAPTDTCES